MSFVVASPPYSTRLAARSIRHRETIPCSTARQPAPLGDRWADRSGSLASAGGHGC
jgi:hypothetical protein